MLNDCCTCATPGVSAAASSRVSASSSSDWSLIDVTTSSGVVPSAGLTASTFGSGVPASGLRLCTAATYVSYDVKIVGDTLSCTSSATPTIVISRSPAAA